MMEEYKIKTKIRNIRCEMIDYEYSYSVGELEPFYQGLAIFRGRNLFEKNYDYYIVNENFEDHFYKVFVAEKDTNLKSASNLNDNLNCSKELEHYAS